MLQQKSGGWMAIAAAAVLAACSANPVPPRTPPISGWPVETPPVERTAEAPAPDARLVLRRSEPLNGRGYAALGLTGANKPNGMEYRLRQSVPAGTPAYVPRSRDGLDLFIADSTADGWLAFYRGPLAGGPTGANVPYRAVLYADDGTAAWDLDLNRFLSRPDQLEVQDVRYADGRLYFNEACQSYAREAGGACSSLLRVDPWAGRVEWRTPPLTSSNILLPHGPYVIAGYGFTAEPDTLFLLDGTTGRVVDRQGLDSAHQYLEMVGGELVVVTTDRVYVFGIEPR